MNLVFAFVVAVLFGTGAYLLLSRELVRVVLGVVVISQAATLTIIASGLVRGAAPIYPLPDGPISDPLSQAMALTAIVIGMAVTALLLALVLRVVASVPIPRARRGRRGGDRTAGSPRRRGRARAGRRGGSGPMTALAISLVIPWAVGAVLLMIDGRRAAVGWAAVVALAATLIALSALMMTVMSDGPVVVTTGDWPAGVGITLRADALGVMFALLSVLVLLAATIHEVADGVRERPFPGWSSCSPPGLTGLFLTADLFNFYVFFELALTASYVLATYGGSRQALGAALVFTAVNLLGTFVFLISVAGVYHVTGTLGMAQIGRADGRRRPQRSADPGGRILRRLQRQARPVPVPLLVADGVHRRAARGRRDPERRACQHRRLRAAPVRGGPAARASSNSALRRSSSSAARRSCTAASSPSRAARRARSWHIRPSARSATSWWRSASAGRSASRPRSCTPWSTP